jgi:hypothetical protein
MIPENPDDLHALAGEYVLGGSTRVARTRSALSEHQLAMGAIPYRGRFP